MSPALRFTLAAAVVAALAGFGVLIARGPAAAAGHEGDTTAPSAGVRFTSSEQCAACHAEVAAEWRGSHHQISYLNPEVRKLSDDFRNKECQACHLPRPVAETGLLQRTLPRLSRPDQGVDCITCHLGPDGRVVGLRASDRGCAPVADARFMGVDLCATCHNQHQTTDQWRASRFAAEGTTCNACHMPESPRASGPPGRHHGYPGAHDVALLKRAVAFRLSTADGKAILEVENVGAGHNFPTEERHRAGDVLVRFVDGAGVASEWKLLRRFRQPYRDEPGENTQLPAGAIHRSEEPIPDGTRRVEARLWYRLNPYAVDGDGASTLLAELAEDLP